MKTNESIADRIKRIREAKSLTQGALAKLCGWASQSRIGNYESGTRSVSVDDASVIAKALGVNVTELLFGDQYVGDYKPGKRYPLLSWVNAGAWGEAHELKDIEEWYESEQYVEGEAFWLRVQGDSMTSQTGVSVPEGSVILIDTGKEARSGNLVVAKLVDSNEATFKRLVVDGGQRYLKALNPAYPAIPINEGCKIIGVAVQSMNRLI
ncbi:LexA family protein [Rouxiella sp. Mn2063]|uniref:LexA family protein n=1 Tax=Rouxiella sp. Mn2063 TaxID=3395262 RepID=UPI003BD9F496